MAVETECLCAEVYPKINRIIEQKGAQTDSLIEILHAVQQEVGYLPQAVQEYVAEKLDVPAGVVESVVTFYTFFTTVPRGRHLVKVCQGTACYVRGGKPSRSTAAAASARRTRIGATAWTSCGASAPAASRPC
jgi:NADH:ubiquinone oxidoreductase subunit E